MSAPADDFSGLYPDSRTAEQRAAEHRALRPEADLMAGDDATYWREVVNETRRRRAGREDLVQLDVVGRDDRVVIVANELLVRTPTDERALAQLRAALEERGFEEFAAPVELDDRILRWRAPDGRSADDLDAIARSLRAQKFVVSVNHIVPLGPWMKAEGGPELTAGRGVQALGEPVLDWPIATVDTGIVEYRPDNWLGEVPRTRTNVDLLKWVKSDPYLGLGAGHGTFVAGVISQVAQVQSGEDRRPASRIAMWRALDVDGVGSEVDVAVAMVNAVGSGARVLNLSLGSQTLDDQPPVAIQAALEIIDEDEGGPDVVIVAAAGNYGDTRLCWPAAFPGVVSVAALTAAGDPAPWSSHGYWVQTACIGEGTISTYVPGQESPVVDPDGEFFKDDAWAVWLGTSFAAPQIAGLIARLCAEQGIDPRAALAEILRVGTPIPDYGRAVKILPGT